MPSRSKGRGQTKSAALAHPIKYSMLQKPKPVQQERIWGGARMKTSQAVQPRAAGNASTEGGFWWTLFAPPGLLRSDYPLHAWASFSNDIFNLILEQGHDTAILKQSLIDRFKWRNVF